MTIHKKLRLIFMGTPDFSLPALEALIHSNHEVIAVYSQPPRPSGRGYKITKSPVHKKAEEHHIPVFTPKSLRSSEQQQHFLDLKADLAVVAAYGLILPQEILEAPIYGCINIHASLLPRWRGAAPIQHAILEGDKESGVTLMQMDVGLDTGDMLQKQSVEITPYTTGKSLHDTLSKMGGDMLVPLLDRLEHLTPQPQDNKQATYASKLSKEDAALDFTKSAQELDRQVRAFTPWPGSFFIWQGKTIKVLKAHVCNDSVFQEQGRMSVCKETMAITCRENTLVLDELQVQGKKPMKASAFINGYRPVHGDFIEGIMSRPIHQLEV